MFVIPPSPGMNSQASTHIILLKKAAVISENPNSIKNLSSQLGFSVSSGAANSGKVDVAPEAYTCSALLCV